MSATVNTKGVNAIAPANEYLALDLKSNFSTIVLMRGFIWFLFAHMIGSLPALAVAREQLGRIEIDQLVIRPQFRLLEPANANFELGESLFAVRWEMDSRVSAVFTVGSNALLGQSVHFVDEVTEDLGFVETYGQFVSDYGTLRAGLQPVGLGFEGNVAEADMDLPRSLVYERRLAPLRDIGVSYAIDFNGFFTRMMIHNGESSFE